jgi:peptidyl-prolyl cis-trans isomerase D
MIRFLQKTDDRIKKAIYIVVIGVVSVGMVVYLIPGLTGQGAATADTYATIYPHWYSKLLSSGSTVSQQLVDKMARAQLAQQRYPDNPMILGLFEQRVGEQLIQQQILLDEAEKLGITATDDDVRNFLQTGQAGQVLYPGGKYIGDEAYTNLVATRFNMTVPEFQDNVRHNIVIQRMSAMITAGVTLGDQEVRDAYRKNNIKIKFDYAVISADDLRKTINPSDGDLEAFFKKNSARYATAVPEERKITYIAFTPSDLPGGVPQPTQQEIKAYFDAHQSEYNTPEQARSRHILIKVDPGADAKADAAAKAKAEDILKQLKAGGNFADLAKKNSDDPGSKDSGGELPFAQRGTMVPEFDNAIFTQKIGDIEIVKSQFGYHIVQVEERKDKHVQDISEVLPTIQATLIRQKAAAAEDGYAHQLTAEAIKNGLEKTAAAHHLELVTTPPVNHQGVISALPDGSKIVGQAFEMKQGDPPQSAPTGEGYAIFQVTGISPAHAPAFADWKTHVLDDYRDQQLPQLLSAKTKELADKAQAGHDLPAAAKQVGATIKTSDLVAPDGQVPDLGQVQQAAPQLLDLTVGAISGPIETGRNGIVAKIVDKQEPTADEIAKNFDQTRDHMLEERRDDAFKVFMSGIMDDYKKNKRIAMNPKNQKGPQIPGM